MGRNHLNVGSVIIVLFKKLILHVIREHNGEKLCKCDQYYNIVHLKVVLYVIC